jgi:hypothetical protein
VTTGLWDIVFMVTAILSAFICACSYVVGVLERDQRFARIGAAGFSCLALRPCSITGGSCEASDPPFQADRNAPFFELSAKQLFYTDERRWTGRKSEEERRGAGGR